jgi:hypothetical protein
MGVSLKEIWMLLGEKDVQIYQLLKEKEVLEDLLREANGRLEQSSSNDSVRDVSRQPEES